MGITHHLENMRVRPRSIDKILEKSAANIADGKDDGTTRKLATDFENKADSNQSQEATKEAGDSGKTDWEMQGEGWTQSDWDEWATMGCPDDNGITVPVGLTAAALNPQLVPHQPLSILVPPSTDISVGMRDPNDPWLWPDLFYRGKDVKAVMSGN